MKRAIVCGFAAMLILSACETPDSAAEPFGPIEGAWRIEDVNNGGIVDSSKLEIKFGADGKVTGNAGCNTFFGPYTRNGAAIDIGPLASTRRACLAEALNAQETRVLKALDDVTSLSGAEDGALLLKGPPPTQLLLRRTDDQAPAMTPLTVSGEVFFLERIALPSSATLRITALDIARMDVAATELAKLETPAGNGPPFPFTLDIPRDKLNPQSQVAVRAQIFDGARLMFTSTERISAPLEGTTEPLKIRVSIVTSPKAR